MQLHFKVKQCFRDDECSDDKFCSPLSFKCENPCEDKICSNAYCTAENHRAICKCIEGYSGINCGEFAGPSKKCNHIHNPHNNNNLIDKILDFRFDELFFNLQRIKTQRFIERTSRSRRWKLIVCPMESLWISTFTTVL